MNPSDDIVDNIWCDRFKWVLLFVYELIIYHIHCTFSTVDLVVFFSAATPR